MPDDRAPIRRIHNEASAIAEQNAQMREQIAKALELLKAPVPDTFLGRKTQKPFPSADGEE
ncbi:hypothetical protein [Bradyrhizobium guangdongense]|uniref:Uncharacterized protein n=1 Tax=Bradyrhizobium guangdongense TaxID=1325090 RepID=A0A410V3R4_9BRAD|nr:hypothetical protein [Bradyrhizobium guangdongense]QAU38329.1 hypothetical protein X265_12060 [Bradyrhizobium guangdongense]QOZ59384.1 hypothetical protein XH86_12060 [Bradyrhizobium guangdongense]GGI34303.1 hypothetical protein GCM10010987_78720 [Bradyrhizobium guangdongense]